MSTPKKRMGRPPKANKVVNPQVQFGRHPRSEIDEIDEAAQRSGKTRSQWAWEILLKAARKKNRK